MKYRKANADSFTDRVFYKLASLYEGFEKQYQNKDQFDALYQQWYDVLLKCTISEAAGALQIVRVKHRRIPTPAEFLKLCKVGTTQAETVKPIKVNKELADSAIKECRKKMKR